MAAKYILWVKARPDYEPLFSTLDGLRLDSERRYWIERREAEENISSVEVDTGQMSAGVEIRLQMSQGARDVPQRLDNRRGVRTMRVPHFKSEITQRTLSDLGRGWHVNMHHASRKPSVI